MAGKFLDDYVKTFLSKGGILIKADRVTWDEFNDKMKKVFGKVWKRVDDLYFNVIAENRLAENMELEDCQALEYLQKLQSMDGDGILYVITDLCYVDNKGPFVVRAEDIGSFVHTYSSTYKEPFYSTDIIVVNFEEKLLWVLFHEGVCWLTKG